MMEEKMRELIAKAPDLAQPIEEFAYKYQQWLGVLEAALARSGAGRMQNAVCFTCEGESGLPPSQTVDICQRCYGDELEWKTLPDLAQPSTAKEKEVPVGDRERGDAMGYDMPPRAKAGETSGEWDAVGDELNQCLQIILTNAGNITTGEQQFRNEVDENKAAIGNIESAVQRAAKTIRAYAAGRAAAAPELSAADILAAAVKAKITLTSDIQHLAAPAVMASELNALLRKASTGRSVERYLESRLRGREASDG